MNAVNTLNLNANAWKHDLPKSAMPNFRIAPTKPSPTAHSQVNDLPKSFTESLAQIDTFKGKFREAKYHLLASVYLACRLGYKNKTKAEIDENDEVLSEICTSLKIDGRTYYQKLGKLAFGDDSKRVSSIVHVIKVAETHSIEPEDFVNWLKEEGGIQKIRTTYNVDGTTKNGLPTEATSAAKDQAERHQYYIDQGKAALTSSTKATIPVGQLSLIDTLGSEGECTAILRQRADGSFVIKVVLNDKNLVDQLYCAHGRTLQSTAE